MAPKKEEAKKEEAVEEAPKGNRKSRRGAAGKEAAKEAAKVEALAELQKKKEELQRQLEVQKQLEREQLERRKAEREKQLAAELAAIAPLSDEERAAEVKDLMDVAKTLMELATRSQAATRAADIKKFATAAAGFAGKIRNAPDGHAAAVLAKEVAKKKEQWSDLAQMMAVAIQMEEINDEEAEALKLAEDKLRSTAEQLSKVSQGGDSKVFGHIKTVAKDAEDSLEEFLAAETNEKKWEAFEKAEQKREKWLTQIHGVQETMHAEDAADKKPGEKDDGCEYIEADDGCQVQEVDAALTNLNQYLSTSFGSWDSSAQHFNMPAAAPSGPAVVLASSPQDVRSELRDLVWNEDTGLIADLVKGSIAMKGDSSFDTIFEEVNLLMFHCHALMTASEKPDKMRQASHATAAIRKAAFAIQKFDIYTATDSSEKIETCHPEVARCSKLFMEVAEFFKAELHEAPLDDAKAAGLLKMVRETKVAAPPQEKPSRMSSVVVC